MLLREPTEGLSQESPPSREPRHHGADGTPDDLGDLLVRQPLQVREDDHLAEWEREGFEGAGHVAMEHRLEELLVGLAARRHGLRDACERRRLKIRRLSREALATSPPEPIQP